MIFFPKLGSAQIVPNPDQQALDAAYDHKGLVDDLLSASTALLLELSRAVLSFIFKCAFKGTQM